MLPDLSGWSCSSGHRVKTTKVSSDGHFLPPYSPPFTQGWQEPRAQEPGSLAVSVPKVRSIHEPCGHIPGQFPGLC